MMQLLVNPQVSVVINAIGTIFAGIAVLPYILEFINRPKKALVCTIKTLFEIQPWAKENFQLIYNNQLINNPSFLEIEIKNIGNVDIPSKDIEKPITLNFNQEAKVLSYEIHNAKPENLSKYATLSLVGDSKVKLNPILLNKKSFIQIRFLINNFFNFDIECLILGIPEIKQISPIKATAFLRRYSFLIALMSVAAFAIGNLLGHAFRKMAIGFE